jgi:hypothetical protein
MGTLRRTEGKRRHFTALQRVVRAEKACRWKRLSGVARATSRAAREIRTFLQSLAARARATRRPGGASFEMKSDAAKST